MKRTRQERMRLAVMAVAVVFFFGLAVARLVHLQIINGERYSRIVEKQSRGTVGIPGPRGWIFDRNGEAVAKNVGEKSLYAYPQSGREIAQVYAYIDRLYGKPRGSTAREYQLGTREFTWIDRMMEDHLVAKVVAEAPPGLKLREEASRSYPYGTVGKQIIGFTDIDNNGRSGLELTGDTMLAGDSGIADIRRDGRQTIYRVEESALIKPVPGRSLVLTVDWRLQEIVENELALAVDKYNARYAMAAFLDCHTGEILAIAHFDPEETNREKPSKLRAISDWFEPGSSFKAFTAAGILDAGIVNFSDTTYCEMGKWDLGRRTLHDDKELGWLTFREIIELSSNIGIGKHAVQLGGEELLATIKRFGFGQKLRCGLPGETAGRIAVPNRWSEYMISAVAMGHSVAVNTLQMANAYAAVANGGLLLRPRIVLGYVDTDGRLVQAGESELLGRAMEPDHVDSLHAFLRGVVERGTATPANSDVIAIAGKTGTGEIPNLTTGGMTKNRFVASFGGFFPADQPQVAGVVVVVDPRPITYGGYTAGPAFRRIAERYAVIEPDKFDLEEWQLVQTSDEFENTLETPDFLGRDIILAEQMASQKGIKIRSNAADGVVDWQFPPPDRLIFTGEEVIVSLAGSADSLSALPDLRGLSVRAAGAYLHHLGLPFRVEGNGRVVQQYPQAGSPVNRELMLRLTCRPG